MQPDVVLFSWCATGAVVLDALVAAKAPPRLIVTGKVAPLSLAIRAESQGIELLRVGDVNAPAFVAETAARSPGLAIVAGCAQIWRGDLLGAFRLGAVNLHPSLLPRHRGRDPVFWTIFAGDTVSGVTAHRMTADVDAGPILAQREVSIDARATGVSLGEALDHQSAALVPDLLAMAMRGDPGRAASEPGSHERAVRTADGAIDFNADALAIDRLVRAALGSIHAHASVDGMKLIVLEAEPAGEERGAAGTILAIDDQAITVAAGDGAIALRRFLFLDSAHDPESIAALLGLRVGGLLANGSR